MREQENTRGDNHRETILNKTTKDTQKKKKSQGTKKQEIQHKSPNIKQNI